MVIVLRRLKFERDKPFLWKEKEMTDSKKASVINHHPCIYEIPFIYVAISGSNVKEK